jgi:DNA-binding transcriptional MerR regulator
MIEETEMQERADMSNTRDHKQVSFAQSTSREGMENTVTARRRDGEKRSTRNARLTAAIAERLSSTMDFGELDDADLYTIGQLSDHLQVSLRTLRFYEQSGLLKPHREGLKRLYTREDIDRLQVIVALREMEASLTAIKALMARFSDGTEEEALVDEIREMLEGLAEGNRDRITELERINTRILTTVEALGV